MSLVSTLLRGRALAESHMVDACTITRVTAQTVDPETGIITPTATTTVYAGKCRFRQKVPVSKPANVGEAFIWLQRLELQLPMAVTGVASDDLVTATASVLDGDLVGRRWRIRELSHQTHQTARRHQIEEVTS